MLRAAAVQAEAVPGDIAGNLARAVRWIERAAERGAGLVVFPEACTTGYGEEIFTDLHRAGALPGADLAWTDAVQPTVDATGTAVVLNTPLDHGTHRTLSSVLLRAGHEPVTAYAKQHLDAAGSPRSEPPSGCGPTAGPRSAAAGSSPDRLSP